jgi:hypothetical protein
MKKPNKNKFEQTQKQIMLHIDTVRAYMYTLIDQLMLRATYHDRSKLFKPEIETFHEAIPLLKNLEYGSVEYKKNLVKIRPALEHHYANNSHHVEAHVNGISGMDLLDIIEMFCDWNAAVLQHESGDIQKSIEINKERFNMSDELVSIFKNTLKYFKNKEEKND